MSILLNGTTRPVHGPGHTYLANGIRFTPTVFLSSSIGMYGTPIYHNAARWLQLRYPFARHILPAHLWRSHAHWRDTYRDVLRPVTHHAILTDLGGFIGAGCVEEYFYLSPRVHVQLALIPRAPLFDIWRVFDMEIIDWSNLRHFARLINIQTGEVTVGRQRPCHTSNYNRSLPHMDAS